MLQDAAVSAALDHRTLLLTSTGSTESHKKVIDPGTIVA